MNNELMVERHGPVAWLTVNRPEVRNALSLEITQRIAETLRDLSRDRTLRVFVLTGAGDRVFVSGADVREFREQLATPEAGLQGVVSTVRTALRSPYLAIERNDKILASDGQPAERVQSWPLTREGHWWHGSNFPPPGDTCGH